MAVRCSIADLPARHLIPGPTHAADGSQLHAGAVKIGRAYYLGMVPIGFLTCGHAVVALGGAGGGVIVAGALRVLQVPHAVHVDGGGEAAGVAEHDPAAAKRDYTLSGTPLEP